MAVEDRSLSEFPRALQVAEQALVMISNPDGLGGYDTNGAVLTEVGKALLNVQYTQQLGNVSVFDAIKNTRVLSGTTTPTANEGANGQLYVKYETVSNVDSVVGMYFKKDGAWLEISLGGGGGADYVECTQAQYDAWEQAGTLDPTVMYFITDGQSGGGVVIDDTTTAQDKVWSSEKVAEELGDTHVVKTNINPSVVPTGHITKNATEIHDINDSQVLRLEAYQAANTGNVRGQIVVSRPVGGTTNINYLYLGIKPNGDKEVFVSEPKEWRNALSVSSINIQTYEERITLAAGRNRFNHVFTSTSGYTPIGLFVEWNDTAISSVNYQFSWMQFGNRTAFVDIISPDPRTGGKLKYTLLEYKA